jgi:HAD superfamily hydrolase (TIGR01509 family)
MIKAIFIDWGNVFGMSSKKREKKLDAILKPFGFTWKKFYPIWWQFYLLRSSGKIKTDRDFEFYINKGVGKNIPVKEIIKIRIDSGIIPQDHIEVVNELKKKYKVGILSNQVEGWVRGVIKNYGIEKLFNSLTISSAVGERKPHAKIYYQALKALSVKPEESAFVADEVAEDLVAASGLGMKTIWYNNHAKGRCGEDDKNVLKIYKPDAMVKKLQDLPKVIESFSHL